MMVQRRAWQDTTRQDGYRRVSSDAYPSLDSVVGRSFIGFPSKFHLLSMYRLSDLTYAEYDRR